MRRLLVLVLGAFVLLTAGWAVAPGASAAGGPPDRSLDAPAGTYEDPSTLLFVLLLAGLLALTVLVGALAARAGRRADRRELRVVVLTRD